MFVFNDKIEFEDLGNGVKRKVLAHDGNMMSVEVHFDKGVKIKTSTDILFLLI